MTFGPVRFYTVYMMNNAIAAAAAVRADRAAYRAGKKLQRVWLHLVASAVNRREDIDTDALAVLSRAMDRIDNARRRKAVR